MKYEYMVSEIGWPMNGDWLRIQQESLAEKGAEGWELVSVVLLETGTMSDKITKDFMVHAMAMYFKRPAQEPVAE